MLSSVRNFGLLKPTKSRWKFYFTRHLLRSNFVVDTFPIQSKRWIILFLAGTPSGKCRISQVINNNRQLMYLTKEAHDCQLWIELPAECRPLHSGAFWKGNWAVIRECAVHKDEGHWVLAVGALTTWRFRFPVEPQKFLKGWGVGGGRWGKVLCKKQNVNFVPRALLISNGRAPLVRVLKDPCLPKMACSKSQGEKKQNSNWKRLFIIYTIKNWAVKMIVFFLYS